MRLLTLVVFAAAVTVLSGPVWTFLLLAMAVAMALAARAWRSWRLLVGITLTALMVGAYQWFQRSPWIGVEVGVDLVSVALAAVALASGIAASDVMVWMTRAASPLRVVGVNPARVGLAAALMWRTIPEIVGAFDEAREAAVARGVERNVRARVLPVVVRTVAHARARGEALAARGMVE